MSRLLDLFLSLDNVKFLLPVNATNVFISPTNVKLLNLLLMTGSCDSMSED